MLGIRGELQPRDRLCCKTVEEPSPVGLPKVVGEFRPATESSRDGTWVLVEE